MAPLDTDVWNAVQMAGSDARLVQLSVDIPASEGYRAHADRVDTVTGRPPAVNDLVVADLSATTAGGFFDALSRRLVLNAHDAEQLLSWRPGSAWVSEVLHEMLHAAELRTRAAGIKRPGWLPGGRARQVDLILAEGLTDQLTAICAELGTDAKTPFPNYSRPYRNYSGAVYVICGAITSRTRRDYREVLLELWRQPPRQRRRWVSAQLGLDVNKIDSVMLILADGPGQSVIGEIRQRLRSG